MRMVKEYQQKHSNIANRQNKIKKKLWYKDISDYYKNYDVDYRGRFFYNSIW